MAAPAGYAISERMFGAGHPSKGVSEFADENTRVARALQVRGDGR